MKQKQIEKEQKRQIIYCKNCATPNKVICRRDEDIILISKAFCKKCGTQLIFPFENKFKEEGKNFRKLVKYNISKRSFWFKLIWLTLTMIFSLTLIFKVSDLIEKINTQDQTLAILFALLLVILVIITIGRVLRMPQTDYVAEEED